MTQAVSHRPLTAEATGSILCQVHVGFVVDKMAPGQVFLRVLRFSRVSFIPPVLHYTKKRKNYSSSSQGCTISLASAAGPFTKKNCIKIAHDSNGIRLLIVGIFE